MKTVQEVKKEIEEIANTLQTEQRRRSEDRIFKKREVTNMKKRLALLKIVSLYLETNPTIEFLKREVDRIENCISLRMVSFVLDDAESKPKTFISKMRKAHEKMYDIPKLREQVKTMRFILK